MSSLQRRLRAKKKEKRMNRLSIFSRSTDESEILSKFVNLLMRGGKKSLALQILTEAVSEGREMLRSESESPSFSPREFVEQAVKNIEPSFELRNKKIAGLAN